VTIAGRVNTLVIGITLVLAVLVCGFTAVREYRNAQDLVLQRVEALVPKYPGLQLDIYYQDRQGIAGVLGELLDSPGVSYVAVYDVAGQLLAYRSPTGDFPDNPPPLNALRRGASSTEGSDLILDGEHQPVAVGALGLLVGEDYFRHLTRPIFSVVNPLEQGHTHADFATSVLRPEEVSSLFVIGYLHVAVSRLALFASTLPVMAPTLLVSALLVLLSSYITLSLTRRFTASLTGLARVADEVASGGLAKPVQVQGSSEIKEIATILNGIVSGLSSYKTRMDVDHQLLSMKVEERTSQLTRRNQELNQAVKEVTETKDRLRQMAYYDSLTTLPNRRLFTEQLDLLLRLAHRNDEMLGLLFIDLDNFKRINDSLGHRAGDLLLREVATRLSGCVRDSDVVAHYVESGPRIDVSRLGGDEFTVVLNQLQAADDAAVVAQRLIDALVMPVVIEGHELVVTPSIGIAVAPRDAADVDGLLKAADTAMYHAKARGKNNYLFYSGDMDAAGVDRLQLEADIRKALEQEEFVLHYQPQVDTRTGAVVGAEALIRWEHPEKGMIPPFKFIPLVEEMGLIHQMGEWVLREACRQLQSFEAQGVKLPKVAVNVSALQFNPAFIRSVQKILLETGLDPARLELELTEGVVMDDGKSTLQGLDELKELGVSLSIDDFGTGYSSLSYLSRFPLDELKIDRSFVIEFDKSENDASLVVAIIAMARSMSLRLVAEGVETLEQYRFLTRNGAHIIQGYLFSKPVPADELQPLLAPWHFMEQIHQLEGAGMPEPALGIHRSA
jgi:diguanylate cyclase (GGDEF)-like protein